MRPHKAPNRDRVVSPDQDDRLKHVAQAIANAGLPAALADILAEGYIARLRRRVWEAMTDVVGTGDDVESLCSWKGPPRTLCAVFLRAGYLREIGGIMVCPDAVQEAPEYIKKRWHRHDRAGYVKAVKRCNTPNIVHHWHDAQTQEPEDEEWIEEMCSDLNLFGEAGEPRAKDATTPGFKEFSSHWHERFRAIEGITYPWRPADNKFVQQIVTAVPGYVECRNIIDAYLADRSSFFRGHELRKLFAHLAQFRAAAAQRMGKGNGQGAGFRDPGTDANRLIRD